MRRYAAFLRGVTPMNAKMPELRRAFERAGFEDVRTLLASGNVVFSAKPELPIELHDARILAVRGSEVLTAYVPGPKGPVFMTLIEKTFGKDVTTRTWDTVIKAAR